MALTRLGSTRRSGSKRNKPANPSTFTEQGRRMSAALSDPSTSENAFLADTSGEFSNSRQNQSSTKQTPESALLRDQSKLLVKDAFAHGGSGRNLESGVSEFDLPRSSIELMVDDDDDTNGDYNSSDGDSTGRNSRGDKSSAKVTDFAAKESAQVFYAKIFVFIVLCGSAGAVAYLTYWFISSEEEKDAQQQFETDANELLDVSNANGRNIMAVLGIFATLLSSGAAQQPATLVNHTSTWPLYTLPDFEKFGSGSRALSGALLLAYTPLVSHADRPAWEDYSVANQGWVQEGLEDLQVEAETIAGTRTIPSFIYRKTAREFAPETDQSTYSPIWQLSPAPVDTSIVNFNLRNHPTFRRLVGFADFTRQAALSEVIDTSLMFGTSAPKLKTNDGVNAEEDPQSIALLPVFERPNDTNSPIVGHIVAVIPWGQFLQGIIQDGKNDDIYVVLEESCGNAFTYLVNGPNVRYLGEGDRHDRAFSAARQSTEFRATDDELSEAAKIFLESTATEDAPYCEYTIAVYPSQAYNEAYETNTPLTFMMIILLVFLFTSAVFLLYDRFVTKRQDKVQKVAAHSTAIVTSLFPAQVRDKLFQQNDDTHKKSKGGFSNKVGHASSAIMNMDPDVGSGSGDPRDGQNVAGDEIDLVDNSPPIADLFPSATVLFMDIAGFTAWSSAREPSQVFILLETIYRSFDKIAKQRRVFKVETIGDCYVAVCGLPEPNEEHAVVMARFARDCLEKMNELARKLETSLGPDTGDLAMRAGLHSGPVTAGVLRGDRARFQLFGDTVNTAARMESTGLKKKIQISQETAELIIAADKRSWIKPRKDVVNAKGKGELHTFWLLPRHRVAANSKTNEEAQSAGPSSDQQSETDGASESSMGGDDDMSINSETESAAVENERLQRLVDYTSDILLQVLKKITAKRAIQPPPNTQEQERIRELEGSLGQQGICLEEVVEVIELPEFDSAAYSTKNVKVDPDVVSQLVKYVGMISSMYRGNPFHNFDHASHVTQSVSKLLSRIVSLPNIAEAEQQHDHTYGITSDPLTQFAIVFSSLIHDVDHRGVPNFLLVKEDPALGALYQQQAVAEQNSVDVAWNLLMDPLFDKLRGAIYHNEAELRRFRQLVVNSLMATDIFDKQLAGLRKQRWENAFFVDHTDEDPQVSINRKATIVIEHIIQASDVSHTMQHWHVYSKWNAKLYHEMFLAYCHGRSSKDPTEGWYTGELWFFDNYVIPLAHKLKECGVFGVSSDEYLQYAMANRREWEAKGQTTVGDNFEQFKGEKRNLTRRASTQSGESAPLATHQ